MEENEIWKQLYDSRYYISNLGRVKSLSKNHEIFPIIKYLNDGFASVRLSIEKNKVDYRILDLMKICFFSEYDDSYELINIDQNNSNCSLLNLSIKLIDIDKDEEWKEYLNSGYWVSNMGRVKSGDMLIDSDGRWKRNNGRILKGRINTKGYFKVHLYSNINMDLAIHRLVAICFIPNPENKPQVNHKNAIKTDNRLENVEWMTNEENKNHALDNDLYWRGEKNHTTVLTNDQVLEARRRHKLEGATVALLAREMGVHYNTMTSIINKKTWIHLL